MWAEMAKAWALELERERENKQRKKKAWVKEENPYLFIKAVELCASPLAR